MKNKTTVVKAVSFLGAATFALAGCGSGSGSSDSSSSGGSGKGVAAVSEGASQVKITLTNDGGCELDHTSAKAGPVTFTVQNKDASAITEVELQNNQQIIGEKENLAPGLAPVSFTNTLGGGTYQIYCPGAQKEYQNFTVTGAAAKAPTGSTSQLLQDGSKKYGQWVAQNVSAMATAVDKLDTDIQAGNMEQAKSDYPKARVFYEKIESDVDGFVLPGYKAGDNAGNLDYLIDMRQSNLDPKVGWHGFHALERDMYQGGKISDSTKKLSTELKTNVGKLQQMSSKITYKPEDLANGAASLLEEVQTEKIKGEEEAFSHIDLVDFNANVEGAQQAFAYLKPGLEKIDPNLSKTVSQKFTDVNNSLNKYRDTSAAGGFKQWTPQLRSQDSASLSKTVQSLQDPLSKIAQKVATA